MSSLTRRGAAKQAEGSVVKQKRRACLHVFGADGKIVHVRVLLDALLCAAIAAHPGTDEQDATSGAQCPSGETGTDRVGALGEGDDVALQAVADQHLRRRLAVLLRHSNLPHTRTRDECRSSQPKQQALRYQFGVLEFLAFGERRVSLDDDAVLLAKLHQLVAREVSAQLDLERTAQSTRVARSNGSSSSAAPTVATHTRVQAAQTAATDDDQQSSSAT